MIIKTLAHYEIASQFGKGGMGEVYQAKDINGHPLGSDLCWTDNGDKWGQTMGVHVFSTTTLDRQWVSTFSWTNNGCPRLCP
jgi:serine/threonine protein kinase